MVQPGGLALITYNNDCVVRVGSGVWSVLAIPPCANGVSVVDFTGRMNQQSAPTPPPGIPPLVVGGVLVAAGIGIAVLVSQSDKDKPASP